MKVAFFDLQKSKLVEIENLPADDVTAASIHLTAAFSSGRHCMPSPIWVAFDFRGKIRVFFLDPLLSVGLDSLLQNIEAAVNEYVKKIKRTRKH